MPEYFVILADMRTGSNHLEDQLNRVEGIATYGELFNPHFIGRPKGKEVLGFDLDRREADPLALIAAVREAAGLGGFRLFSDHDPRAIDHVLADPGCAKIVLERNPLDSFVSLGIARRTGQWWLGDARTARSGTMRFDSEAYEDYLTARRAWRGRIERGLQTTGQTAFRVGYDDLRDPAVIAGLLAFLGFSAPRRTGKGRGGRVQNPVPLEDKVENYDEMVAALASRDPVGAAAALPDFEAPRGAGVPRFAVGTAVPLMYLPVPGAAEGAVAGWLDTLEAANGGAVERGMSQKTLRLWMRSRAGHRRFTVVQHPVERAHAAFRRVQTEGEDGRPDLIAVLRNRYGVPFPDPGHDYAGIDAERRAFCGFLAFLKANLGGQTGIPSEPDWTTQAVALRGIAQVVLPDHVFRSGDLAGELPALAARLGATAVPPFPAPPPPEGLAALYDASVEDAARQAYRRDYIAFGFGDWTA